jgi:hypothetical protein
MDRQPQALIIIDAHRSSSLSRYTSTQAPWRSPFQMIGHCTSTICAASPRSCGRLRSWRTANGAISSIRPPGAHRGQHSRRYRHCINGSSRSGAGTGPGARDGTRQTRATFVIPVDAEKLRACDGRPICFDWLIWQTLEATLARRPAGAPNPLALAVQHHKNEEQIPAAFEALWENLRNSDLVQIENAAHWNMASKRMEAQARWGDFCCRSAAAKACCSWPISITTRASPWCH